MKPRVVAKSAGLPLGGSSAADTGELLDPSFIDHQHSFWQKWRRLPLLGNWIGDVFYSKCGNVIWIRGSASVDLGSAFYFSDYVARLPIEARPDYTVWHPDTSATGTDTIVSVEPSGYLLRYNGYDLEAFPSISTISFQVDDMLYRLTK